MKFSLYYSRKIAFSKDNRNNLSRIIIFIGRLSVALGIIVSLITVCTGLGAKKAIKERIADFNGHITVKAQETDNSYNSPKLHLQNFQYEEIKNTPAIASVQSYAMISGIMRNEKSFDGVVYKGVGKDFDRKRFEKFIVAGSCPQYDEKGYNNQIVISHKIATDLGLNVKDSIVSIFSKEDQRPVYRKFEVAGIYKTDIKLLDDLFVIGDINQVRKILDMDKKDIGGVDIYLHNIDEIDKIYPQIKNLIGSKNYAEKATDIFPQINDWVNIFDTNIGLIIFIMLVVVVINIIMVLLILIIERTNSIGILKTLGATNFQIRSIFIHYTLLIMIPGLIVGNLIGLGLLLLQKYLGIISLNPDNYFISVVPVDLNGLYILAISSGILLIAAVSMILPSYLISKISPVKSIKYN
ncbi:FtsX-like permease family protein [Elizabethkingia argentiflava]|uniref:FtsX-like permease family protein n=1 Tax=Elizabethkingia argenteiflava TaxID=2681556 RepID=A0A845PW15_9FLAO|nr:FtsX-like permease family protein [Elizabethkingia argenteiflava]NAW50300.1 FtsX-like permease family protein [Elizabethkingia argenteiflava]